MKCHATTKQGTRCKRDTWGGWPMCAQHIQAAIKDLRKAQGFTELYVVKQPEPECEFYFVPE